MSKAAQGKHWYHNETQEGYFLECPEGWSKGRLPIKEETRQKHRANNGMHNMTDEQKQARLAKLKTYRENMSEEQKQHKSEAISKAKKGKSLGRTPWNKGRKGVQEAWNKGMKQPKNEDQISHMVIARNITMEKNGSCYGKPKGYEAWNKGMKYHLPEEVRISMVEKMTKSKELNSTFNISTPELDYKKYLENKYGQENVLTQYRDPRYPYRCDFYIRSLDLFIELNLSWTHGNHPFDPNNQEDIDLLEYWKTKAETSDYYKNAIETWTVRDVEKMKCAKENELNYRCYYNIEEAYND